MDLREWGLDTDLKARHPWEQARADVVQFLLENRAALPLEGASVLDFGCGDAFMASVLAQRLPVKEMIALDRAFTAEVQAKLGPALHPKVRLVESLRALPAGTRVKLVLLLDVLEHCEDDEAVLREILASPALDPKAVFLITVPAFQGLFSKLDIFLGHYRRYNLARLLRAVTSTGLKPVQRSYFFSSLLAPRSVQWVLEKLRLGSEPKGLGAYKKRPWDGFIRSVLWLDFRVCEALGRQGLRLPGLSCFVLARRA